MDILIRAARVIHPPSPFHDQVIDMHISNGVIRQIAKKIANIPDCTEVTGNKWCISPGWIDMHAYFSDPGHEENETIATGLKAASAGGFTHVCVMPHTTPVTQNKAQIEYWRSVSKNAVTKLLPIGAASRNLEGKDLADCYDMHQAGAVAFSDGLKPTPSAGFVERALLYLKAFNGLLMLHPEDSSISKNGQVNESKLSAQIGLPGIPALAEEIAVSQLLYLLEYTGSRLHLLDISLNSSLKLIQEARKKKLNVSASVNAYQLLDSETVIGNFDTRYKTNPPLRSQQEVKALRKAAAAALFDTITSQHLPHNDDAKNLEFDKAAFGMIGLETAYAAANTALHDVIGHAELMQLFSGNARQILGLPEVMVKEGEMADLTLFEPETKWTFSEKNIFSRSKNTPYTGREFTGRVKGVIHHSKSFFNE